MAAILLSLAGSLAVVNSLQANTPVFVYTNRDLILSFSKTGADGGRTSPNDLEVNIGQASVYYAATPGSTITVSQYNSTQIAAAFDNLNDLSWTVGGCVPLGDTGDASVPFKTLWVAAPRLNPSNMATAWVRDSANAQGTTVAEINSILGNAAFYSGTIAANATNNTPSVIAVPVNSGHEAGAFLGPFGNYKNTFQGDVENTTPPNFITGNTTSRSDLYELRPDSTSTQPAGKYLGYFELRANGTLVFVAAGGSTPPPAPVLTITVSNSLQTISFPTTTGASYKLYYTNAVGLLAPTASWPTASTTITGDGTTKSFQDSSTDANRFYRVQAH